MGRQHNPRFDTRDPIVTIEVGPSEAAHSRQTFRIHQGCLQKHSAWFKAKLKDEWNGGPDDIVRLQHYPPEAFALFAEWVYTDTTSRLVKSENTEAGNVWITLAKAYVLGEELLATAFQMEVVGHMYEEILSKPSGVPQLPSKMAEMIGIIYDGTIQDCPGRKWLVDHAKLVWKAANFRALRSELPRDFVGDMTESLWEDRDQKKATSW